MIGKRFRSLPFIFANDNYTLRVLPYFRHIQIRRDLLDDAVAAYAFYGNPIIIHGYKCRKKHKAQEQAQTKRAWRHLILTPVQPCVGELVPWMDCRRRISVAV